MYAILQLTRQALPPQMQIPLDVHVVDELSFVQAGMQMLELGLKMQSPSWLQAVLSLPCSSEQVLRHTPPNDHSQLAAMHSREVPQ